MTAVLADRLFSEILHVSRRIIVFWRRWRMRYEVRVEIFAFKDLPKILVKIKRKSFQRILKGSIKSLVIVSQKLKDELP